MTDQTRTAITAFREHVLAVIASTPAARHSSAVAAIDIDRFLAAHRKEQAIKDGAWPEDVGEAVGQQKMIPISGHGGHGGLDDFNAKFVTTSWHPHAWRKGP